LFDTNSTFSHSSADCNSRVPQRAKRLCFVPQPDVGEDGTVNIIDIATVATAFGCKPGDERWNPVTDMDMNGILNIIDIANVARNFG